ncbi:ABC transporter ATP-binding protein [Salipaludibacillus daqingensis]|uniref:ABC transporter ATP-binding protein n=1 Tax=Salipaludibacillus daqingensis TaxID=3041001 RepID=UPI002474CE1F|nr:ABC transporter ATP-binding protein [Salipaludibacillus daqingensis]
MGELAVETVQLTKKYSGIAAVKDLNLKVPQGKIYGFLGPNGAGKTTTLRLITGLLKADAGKVFVQGKPMPESRLDVLAKTGALIEKPAHYEHLTARENLDIARRLYHVADTAAVDRALKAVGLEEAAGKKVKTFSLGMAQRLGIAYTLLHQPELLIYDEPTNGLDPVWIHKIRTLLKDWCTKYGTTIIISSHLLSEIGQLADEIGVISEGRLCYQGTVPGLIGKTECVIGIVTDDQIAAADLIRKEGVVIQWDDDNTLFVTGTPSRLQAVKKALKDKGIHILNETGKDSVDSLEEAYLSLMNNEASVS